MSTETCYWCGDPATSDEHVPPQCLYPESKDGYGVPKEAWIKVPSCELHNSHKSKDDEYLLCILAMSIYNNAAGLQQALTKVRRALSRSKGLVRAVIPSYETVLVADPSTGELKESAEVPVDVPRIQSSLEHIGRAIYFHRNGRPWVGKVECMPEFLKSSKNQDSAERNAVIAESRDAADFVFANAERCGNNPEVFYYQYHEIPESSRVIIRLVFYGGTRSTVLLG